MSDTPRFGFRVEGGCDSLRKLTLASVAFAGYCTCALDAKIEQEGYLSAFTFPKEFRRHLAATGTTKGYRGRCASPWLWFDFDREDDLDAAVADARRLVGYALDRYRAIDADDVLVFWSGGKGLHVGIPLGEMPPSLDFARVARRVASDLATEVGATIDMGIYDAVRLFRAPNSRHLKTGLHKRRLLLDELLHLSASRLAELAREPLAFDPPAVKAIDPTLAGDWATAAQIVGKESAAKAERQAAVAAGEGRLTRRTLATLRGEDLSVGDRHRLFFSAAANLAELGCPAALAIELLTDAGLDAGLSPSDVRRQIECGLSHGASQGGTQ
jgi:hypothetical protein